MTSRDTRANLALLVLSALIFSLLFEGVARLLVQPSPKSYGTLLGRDLPPLRVIPPRLPDPAGAVTAPRAALRCVTARCNAAIAMLIPARSTSCSLMRLSPNVVVYCWVSLDRRLTGRCSRCVSSYS